MGSQEREREARCACTCSDVDDARLLGHMLREHERVGEHEVGELVLVARGGEIDQRVPLTQQLEPTNERIANAARRRIHAESIEPIHLA